MRQNFPKPILDPEIKRFEGGFVNHPADPGGATMEGVTQRTLDRFCDEEGIPRYNVRNLRPAHRDAIYERHYWDAVQGDHWPSGMDFVVMDAGVNSGPRRGLRWAQGAIGVGADGRWGPITQGAVTALFDGRGIAREGLVVSAIKRSLASRNEFLRGLSHFPTFGKGWMRRTARVEAKSLEMARSAGNMKRDVTTLGGGGTGAVGVDQAPIEGWAGLPFWIVAGIVVAIILVIAWNHRAWVSGKFRAARDAVSDLREAGFNPSEFKRIRADIREQMNARPE